MGLATKREMKWKNIGRIYMKKNSRRGRNPHVTYVSPFHKDFVSILIFCEIYRRSYVEDCAVSIDKIVCCVFLVCLGFCIKGSLRIHLDKCSGHTNYICTWMQILDRDARTMIWQWR